MTRDAIRRMDTVPVAERCQHCPHPVHDDACDVMRCGCGRLYGDIPRRYTDAEMATCTCTTEALIASGFSEGCPLHDWEARAEVVVVWRCDACREEWAQDAAPELGACRRNTWGAQLPHDWRRMTDSADRIAPIPSTLPAQDDAPVVDVRLDFTQIEPWLHLVMMSAGITASISQARQLIEQGGVFVNGERETEPTRKLTCSPAVHDIDIEHKYRGTRVRVIDTSAPPTPADDPACPRVEADDPDTQAMEWCATVSPATGVVFAEFIRRKLGIISTNFAAILELVEAVGVFIDSAGDFAARTALSEAIDRIEADFIGTDIETAIGKLTDFANTLAPIPAGGKESK